MRVDNLDLMVMPCGKHDSGRHADPLPERDVVVLRIVVGHIGSLCSALGTEVAVF